MRRRQKAAIPIAESIFFALSVIVVVFRLEIAVFASIVVFSKLNETTVLEK